MDATEKPRNRQPSHPVHVGVVGAGLSGLRCADVLSQYGFMVTLIEGRDRIGGRICQAPIPGTSFLADMGANWIHGTETNPILDIAKRQNAQFSQWEDTPYVFDEAGKPLEHNQSAKLSSLMWSMLMDALDYSEKNWAHIDQNQSAWDYLQQKLPENIPESETNYDTKRKVLLQMAESWGAYVGSPVHRQSLRFMWLEECLEGENLFCASTYKPILESIAAPVLSHVKDIRYNTVIKKIKFKDHVSNKVLLSSAQEESFEFDEVVLTTPLGWLKRHKDAFNPPLPERLTRAIEAVGYGCLEKVYITFRDSFWCNEDVQGPRCKGFIQWLSPEYASQSNPRRWIQEAVELGSTAAPYGHPTLLFYIYGDQSVHITSALQKLSTKAERDSFLATWFKPYYSRMSGYDESSARCEVVNCLPTDWLNDELAGNGSYTNFQVGVVEGDEDVKALRYGVPDGGLWLAGEHTAPFVGLGTATGAYWSGEAVANRIAEKYGLRGDHMEAGQ